MSPATAGLVVHGVGGIGKSALAAQISDRVGHLEPERMTTALSGEISADTFLSGLASAIRRHPAAVRGSPPAQALTTAERIDVPWFDRLGLLREHVLHQVPVLVVLDDFDDNLSAESGGWTVRDPALAALLASWAGAAPSRSAADHLPPSVRRLRLLRGRPGTSGPSFGFRHLGALSRSGAVELARSLPALTALAEEELDRAWRLLGGHPRAMEYLDALLSASQLGFPEVARHLAQAIQDRTGQPVMRTGPATPTELSPEAAETIALVAGDRLLGELFARLGAEAQGLLIRASVFRAPVGRNVLLLPVGQYSQGELDGLVAECEAAGLLTVDRGADGL